jgi:heme exporter protein B
MNNIFIATVRRDLKIAYRNSSDLLNPLAFFFIVVTLFPLGISPSATVLAGLAPGVLWVAALLATLLSIDGLFRSDYEDGSLEQMLISPQPLFVVVLGKVVGHWLVTGFPLTLLTPVLAVMLFLPVEGIIALELTLLLGTPILSLVGAIGAGLTVGLKRGGLLISVLILPLYVPVLILGTLAVQAAVDGQSFEGHLLWMSALLVMGFGAAPFATAAGLRISASD